MILRNVKSYLVSSVNRLEPTLNYVRFVSYFGKCETFPIHRQHSGVAERMFSRAILQPPKSWPNLQISCPESFISISGDWTPTADHSDRAVFARSHSGIVSSNLTWGTNICVRLFCVCVVGNGLATGWSLVQGVLPTISGRGKAVKAYRSVRGRGSQIIYKIGSQLAVRLSALRAGRPLHSRKISGTHFC
jgi:hypothetical protein